MNMKTTKFLAVLAVFAIAFAVFAVADDNQSNATGEATATGVYSDEAGQTAVTQIDPSIGAPTTLYIKGDAKITGDFTVAAEGSLTIGIVKDADPTATSLTLVGNVTLSGPMTINEKVVVKIDAGKKMDVKSTLTINGVLKNNTGTTTSSGFGLEVTDAAGIITGTGKICGTSPYLVNMKAGELKNVTVSQEDWEGGKVKSGEEIISVHPTANVTISKITILMADMGYEAGSTTETYGSHGIAVVHGSETNAITVTITEVKFDSADGKSVDSEYLIYTNDVSCKVTITKITRDSDVRVKDGYGEFTAQNTKTLGNLVTFDNSIKTLRVAGACEVTKSMSVDNIVFRGKVETTPSLTIKSGDAAVKLTVNGDIAYHPGASLANPGATITIEGTNEVVNKGTTRIDGAISITSGASGKFVNDGTLIMDNGVVIKNLTNTKTVRLYNGAIGAATGSAAGDLVNDGTIYVMDEKAKINVSTKSGSGTIDTSAIAEEVFIHGDISTAGTIFKTNQTVTFDGDTTLKAGADITFLGLAVIPTGITVTIEDGASMKFNGVGGNLGKLVNDGRLVIEGAKGEGSDMGLHSNSAIIENNGEMSLEYDGQTAKKLVGVGGSSTFTNNGTILIGEKSIMISNTSSFVNSAKGVIVINGDLQGTAGNPISNSGSVTINSEVNSAVTVSNAVADAEVNVFMTAKTVTVNDDKFLKPEDTKFVNGGNSIVLTPTGSSTCGGVTITSSTFKVVKSLTSIETHTSLVIEGSLIVSTEQETVPKATLTFTSSANGRIAVADELTLTNTTFSTAASTNLYVSGTLSVMNTSTFANAGNATVGGILYMIGSNINNTGVINAAMYEIPATVLTDKVTVYTNVPDAIEGAKEASVKTVTITGTVDIEESVLIPAGMTVKVSGTTSTVTIAKDVVVEVDSDGTEFAVLNNEGTIKVNGKLIYDDAKKSQKGDKTKIESEVILESGNTIVYTTLAWAIADAGSELAILKLCGPTTITTNMTIPENITVDTNDQKFTVDGAVLTIDGFLLLKGTTVYTVTGTDPEVIVNGAIISEKEMNYNGKEYPAGLYFSVGDRKTYYIGSIDDAEAWALLADDGELRYEGDLKTIGISFDADATLDFNGNVTAVSMTVGSNAIVNFNKNVEIATVTMGEATISFAQGKTIDGIFTSPVGTIAFDEALVNDVSKIAVTVKSTVTTMTLSGDVGKAETEDDYEYQVSTLGDVVIKAKLADLYVGAGTTTIGKSVSIDYILVDGDLVIDNDFKLTAKDGYVYGSITANDATDTKKKATVEFTGYLYVGINFDEDAIVAAAATVAGDVTAKYAFVSADATVSDTITDMLYSTDVYVEGVEELTIYSTDSKYNYKEELDEIAFVISDPSAADTGKWVDEDGKDVESYVIGAYDAIYEVFNYNIYDVEIITDAGIKSVAINGIELKNAYGNIFTIDNLTAGTYKVTYTLKNGYSGEAVLSTSTGTILKDNSFVISPGSETALSFQMAGTEPTPEPEPVTPEEKSEWTVTTILLVILVILIAIMAVIVALRLNRN